MIGATPVPERRINSEKKTITRMIGSSHHFLVSFRNPQSSLTNPASCSWIAACSNDVGSRFVISIPVLAVRSAVERRDPVVREFPCPFYRRRRCLARNIVSCAFEFLPVLQRGARCGHVQPSERGDNVPRHSIASRVLHSERVLGERQSVFSGPAVPRDGLRVVFLNALAIQIRSRERVLGVGVTLLSRLAKPGGRFTRIPGDALAVTVRGAQAVLRGGVALLRSLAKPR